MANNIKIVGTAFKPELRYTGEGKPVFRMSVSLYTGGTKEKGYNESVWIRVSAFDELAEHLNQAVTERAKVTVTGQMAPTRVWKGDDGREHTDVCVIAREVVVGDALNGDAQTAPEEW